MYNKFQVLTNSYIFIKFQITYIISTKQLVPNTRFYCISPLKLNKSSTHFFDDRSSSFISNISSLSDNSVTFENPHTAKSLTFNSIFLTLLHTFDNPHNHQDQQILYTLLSQPSILHFLQQKRPFFFDVLSIFLNLFWHINQLS